MNPRNLQLNKQQLIARLAIFINNYESNAVCSTKRSTWMLDGRPGKNGFARLARLQNLLKSIAQDTVNDTEAAYRVAEFYLEESAATAFRSRLLDGLEKLLEKLLGIPAFKITASTNAYGVMREIGEHDEMRQQAIQAFVDQHTETFTAPLNYAPALEAEDQEFINDFEKLLNQYRNTLNSSAPWYFGGKPSQAGQQRLARAENLLQALQSGEKDMEDLQTFHRQETTQSIWSSRLLDGIERLLTNYGVVSHAPEEVVMHRL